MLLQIATINKYCYNNEINKTTNDESFASVVFLMFKLLNRTLFVFDL